MTLSTDVLDFELDANGDLIVTDDLSLVAGLDGVVQLIRVALLTFKGEWFPNLDHGLDYHGVILGAKFDRTIIENEVRRVISTVDEVEEILQLEASFESNTRTLTVTWQVRTAFGDTEIETEIL